MKSSTTLILLLALELTLLISLAPGHPCHSSPPLLSTPADQLSCPQLRSPWDSFATPSLLRLRGGSLEEEEISELGDTGLPFNDNPDLWEGDICEDKIQFRILNSESSQPFNPSSLGYKYPTPLDQVLVSFTGSFKGEVFDQTVEPILIDLSSPPPRIPKGLVELLLKMRLSMSLKCTLKEEYAFPQGFPPLVPAGATVNYEVTLLDWNSVYDLYNDSTVTITRFGQSEGYFPNPQDSSRIAGTVTSKHSGTNIQQTSFNITLGDGDMHPMLELCLQHAEKGRALRVVIAEELGPTLVDYPYSVIPLNFEGLGSTDVEHNDEDDSGPPPLSQDMQLDFEILDIEPPYTRLNVDRLESATKRKNRGNECYRKGDLQGALKWYDKAMMVVRSPRGFRASKKQAEELNEIVRLNRAACMLKLSRYEEAVFECQRVLETERGAVSLKAWLRLAEAQIALGHEDDAETALLQALMVQPGNPTASKSLANVRAKRKESKAKQSKVYRKMFAGGKKRASGAESEAKPDIEISTPGFGH